jgi:transcriptional antiterminator NusG
VIADARRKLAEMYASEDTAGRTYIGRKLKYKGKPENIRRSVRRLVQYTLKKGEQTSLNQFFKPYTIKPHSEVELKSGKKKESERKFFPGYMLINMELTEPSWLLVKNTNNVMGFIGGSSGKPSPITQREVDRIFARVQEGADKPKHKVAFQPGEEILVIDGPFNEFNGTVESVDYEKSLLKVEVLIFGRTTAVELEFSQVEKS